MATDAPAQARTTSPGRMLALATTGFALSFWAWALLGPLGPALREELILRVPDYVVCSESCRGLCPSCGVNLNETTCECVPEAESSPWSVLLPLTTRRPSIM